MNFKNWKQHQSTKPLLRFKELRVPEERNPQKKQNQINTRSSVKNSPKNDLEFGSKSSLGIAPNIYFIKTLQFKKNNVPEKNAISYMFRPNILPKKGFNKKEMYFFGAPKKSTGSKKILVPKENNSYFFGQNIVPKKYERQKKIMNSKRKRNSYFFGPNIVPKKIECQKKV